MTTKLTNSIRKFHRDEEGLEALQVVMIIAIAAMVMIACATIGKTAVTWMQGKWTTLQGIDPSGGEQSFGVGAVPFGPGTENPYGILGIAGPGTNPPTGQ